LTPRIWYPVAVIGCVLNAVAFAFAVLPAEPWHAAVHATLAVAFGLWAQHLKARPRAGELDRGNETEFGAILDEVGALRRELSELQERMDFAERVLSQTRERERLPDRPPGE
jgi:hypothetical protein